MTSSKWSLLGVFFATVFVLAYGISANPESLPHRYYVRYIAHLDRTLHSMMLPTRGQWIVVGQLFCLEVVGLLCLGTDEPQLYLGLPAVLAGPAVYLEMLRRRRLAKIDKQVDGFLLTLANALRATPSIGNALSYTQSLIESPMKDELRLALQEMRLGNSVDQALLHMGGRLKSASLDSALMALLIGRQVGGELTRVLEGTAATLREMARLQGSLRAKTAESKAQMYVMALFPAVVVYAFNRANAGYFDPLLQTTIGQYLIGGAVALWLISLVVAKRMLAVEL